MMKSLDDEVFAIAFAIAKRCSNRKNLLHNDRFPASGTDFSLDGNFQTADWQV